MKSESEGPALRRSRKMVGGRRVIEVGWAVGSVGSETAVAKVRVEYLEEGWIGLMGVAYRQRNLVNLEAILALKKDDMALRRKRFKRNCGT